MVRTDMVEPSTVGTSTVQQGRTFGWMLMGLLALQLAISVPISWVLDSYFNVDVPASLMFFGDDGWCNTATESVGNHCFGDFHERFQIDPSKPLPWPTNLELSPLGPVLTATANGMANFLPSRLVLCLVILAYSACLLVPAVWAGRGRPWPLRFLIVGVTGIGTYPFVVTMDRLNGFALAVPLILSFLIALGAGNSQGVLFSILALTVIKPQFIVLYLVLVALRKMRAAAVGVLATGTAWLVLVAGAGGGDLGRIPQWFSAATNYGNGSLRSVEDFSPINVSLSRLVYIGSKTLESLQQTVFGSQIAFWTVAQLFLFLLLVSVLLTATGILVLWGRRIPPVALGIAALVLSTMILGEYVAAYYLGFALPVCALFLRRVSGHETHASIELCGEIDRWSERQSPPTWMQRSLLAATTLSCSLIIVPLLTANHFGFMQDRFHRVAPIMQNLATASWMVFLVIACGVATRSFVKEKTRISPDEAPQLSHDLARPNLRSKS
jgi:hypothetical protein